MQSRVRMALHGPQGDVNGALLDDGTIVRLPPPETYRSASLLQPGQTIVAEGTELVTAMGKVLDAQQIGALARAVEPRRNGPRNLLPGAAHRRVPDLDRPVRHVRKQRHSPVHKQPVKGVTTCTGLILTTCPKSRDIRTFPPPTRMATPTG